MRSTYQLGRSWHHSISLLIADYPQFRLALARRGSSETSASVLHASLAPHAVGASRLRLHPDTQENSEGGKARNLPAKTDSFTGQSNYSGTAYSERQVARAPPGPTQVAATDWHQFSLANMEIGQAELWHACCAASDRAGMARMLACGCSLVGRMLQHWQSFLVQTPSLSRTQTGLTRGDYTAGWNPAPALVHLWNCTPDAPVNTGCGTPPPTRRLVARRMLYAYS